MRPKTNVLTTDLRSQLDVLTLHASVASRQHFELKCELQPFKMLFLLP